MALKSLALKNRLLLVLCWIVSLSATAQTVISNPDSVFTRLFDADLNVQIISYSTFFSKPTVIISNANCIACTEYFTKEKKKFNFVFILSNESLGEIGRIKAKHKFKKGEVFFTTCKAIHTLKPALCSNPTPCLIYKTASYYYFMDYPHLNSATSGFLLKTKALKKKLNE